MIDFFGDSLSKDRTLEIPYAYVDKYGNLYSNINYSGVSYILKRDGSIDKVVDTWGILFKALDGIMYCVKINESFAPDGTYIRSEEGKCFNAKVIWLTVNISLLRSMFHRQTFGKFTGKNF